MAEWLKNIRFAKKISGESVAKSCGISQQYYNFIENGKRRPSVSVAKRIASVLGFEWTRFYDEVDSRSEQTEA